ncbi:VWA domain-containing protein [Marinobacter fonticola]|uniref:VWA domain-containing protein n=1 Tax=Marinobacter fonticola TaxID=2603215 RepID=UPI0011E86F47|nr:VWA domain-containing protein [Marinobacter fonticola]
MSTFRKMFFSLAVTLMAVISTPSQAVILTDIVMVVDESGSMGNVQANLRSNIGKFASILSAGGVNARYGLVGYGRSDVVPRMLTDLTDPSDFATAAESLETSGGIEPAYAASAFALNALDEQDTLFSFRSNAVKNIIVFTDEPSNGDTYSYFDVGTLGGDAASYSAIDRLLTDERALFNAVLSGSSTIASLGGLAEDHGGQVFDLAGLNTTDTAVVEDFVDVFANAKLQETIDYCTANPTAPGCEGNGGGGGIEVPEPGSMALFGIGIVGLILRRRASERNTANG